MLSFLEHNLVNISYSLISNTSPTYTSGTLKLVGWATLSPYSGGAITGYQVATSTFLNVLGPNQFFSARTIQVPFSPPPDGTWYLTLAIEEYQWPPGAFVIDDYVNFPLPVMGGSGSGSGTVNTTSLNFGSVPAGSPSTPQTVTVTNSGTNALGISSTVVSGPNAADFTPVNNCPSFLAPSTQCTLSVKFLPSHTTAESATLTITYSNSIPVTQTVALSGTGVSDGLLFVPVAPCRVADTRNSDGPLGGPIVSGNTTRDFLIPSGGCGIPPTALAYSLNVTVVPNDRLGYLSIWPTGQIQPVVSTLNSLDGRVKANAAIVPAGSNGSISVFAQNDTHVILDMNGYFVPATNTTGLAFYPLTPCRVLDTRNGTGTLGGPAFSAGESRTLPIPLSACNIPSSARAYSLNFTVVPSGSLGYISAWPSGQEQPLVSTLNDVTGTIVANAAILPAGLLGDISVFTQNATDVIIDINGYFAPPGDGGLALYNLTPCRVLDTRDVNGAFAGPLDVKVSGASCGVPAAARSYVLNATVVPSSTLGYLSLWPDGQPQPLVSTLNAVDGSITSNMAIVPTANGSVDAFAQNATQLILDCSAYFAP